MTLTTFLRRVFTSVTSALIVSASVGAWPSVGAIAEPTVIRLPIYGQLANRELALQAELLAAQAINQRFQEDAAVATVQVTVVGDRNGEIIPLLTTTVARAQWQATPEVRVWSKYYGSAYGLLQRSQVVATTPFNLEAFQSKKSESYLTGPAAQAQLSRMD